MVNAVGTTTPHSDGSSGGAITNNALAAAATSPGLPPSAHCMPAAKHHSATTTTNATSLDAVNAPRNTAAPICNDTMMTSGTRPPGLSCSAMAPAIAAALAAHTAAIGEFQYSATAAIARTPSRLRATAPASGVFSLRASTARLPSITCPL